MDSLQSIHLFDAGRQASNGLKSPAMANPEHLAILKQGVEAWNRWKERLDRQLWEQAQEDYQAAIQEFELGPALSLKDFFESGEDFESQRLSGWVDLAKPVAFQADLAWVQAKNEDLRGLLLQGCVLKHGHFRGTILASCDFSNADLRFSDLRDADLTGADLRGSDLCGADLRRTNLQDCRLGNTSLVDIDLSTVRGLESTHHSGPSFIDFQTITDSWLEARPLPVSFLQGCGLPKPYIEWLFKHLPNKYPSVFISHSSADERFANRLKVKLRDNSVRCWFFPEDAKWGETVWGEIGKGIHDYDRLLVICSEASLKSGPVNREIERALQKEDREGKPVLFPITLDRFLFDGWQHERKPDVVAKVVGDFTDWKSPDSYRKAFKRLLRDLKTETP